MLTLPGPVLSEPLQGIRDHLYIRLYESVVVRKTEKLFCYLLLDKYWSCPETHMIYRSCSEN